MPPVVTLDGDVFSFDNPEGAVTIMFDGEAFFPGASFQIDGVRHPFLQRGAPPNIATALDAFGNESTPSNGFGCLGAGRCRVF